MHPYGDFSVFLRCRFCERAVYSLHAVVKREHLAGFRINWDDKAANLASLAGEMNLGLDDSQLASLGSVRDEPLADKPEDDGEERPAASAEDLFDDLASLLQKRQSRIVED